MTPDRHESGTRPVARYRVTGMDCASDAAEIEGAAGSIVGVVSVRVSTASQTLTVTLNDAGVGLARIEAAVTGLGYQLHPLTSEVVTGDGSEAAQRSPVAPAYRHALALVAILNVGYGIVETIGGFASGSQALKADSLDFFGDGLITLLGLLALSWTIRRRALTALIQGLFFGTLGLSVLGATAYRIVVRNGPEAELMGVFGSAALVVNLLAAILLLPHRTGDVNARAIWLFSRNDAIGNAAVVAAAGLVSWTNSAWPDLVVAAIIAALFLHSAWTIVGDARADLNEAVHRTHSLDDS